MWALVLFTIMLVNGHVRSDSPVTSTVIHYFKSEKSCIEAGHSFVEQNRVNDFRVEGNLGKVDLKHRFDLGHRFQCVEIGK